MKTFQDEATIAEIRGRIGTLTEADGARWGVMTVREMVCHVREAYCWALVERRAAPGSLPRMHRVVKFFALRAPVRWPKGVPTLPELKKGQAGMIPGGFEWDRDGLLAALERFAAAKDNRNAHAIFGSMQPGEWMRWGYLHADHHLRQFGR